MVELGELEKRHADFESRSVGIFAIANDDLDTTKLTQAKFPHLTIVADPDLKMAAAMQVIHKAAGPKGDVNAPTTFLVDGAGKVRWFFRADRFMERLSPDALLQAADKHLLTPTINGKHLIPGSTAETLPD
jgi:peroxiredoxin